MKEYLSYNGYQYEEIDITKDQKARTKLITEYHSYSTPTIVIAGEIIRGFDLEKLETLLKK